MALLAALTQVAVTALAGALAPRVRTPKANEPGDGLPHRRVETSFGG